MSRLGNAWLQRLCTRLSESPLARATAANWGASMSIVVLGIVRAKINAVSLGSEGMGVVSQANYLSVWIGSVATIGLSTGCIRAIAAARAQGDEDGALRVSHMAVLVPVLLGSILSAIVVFSAPLFAQSLVGSKSLSWVISLAALSVPLNLFSGGIATVLQGEERIGVYARANLVAAVMNTIVVVVLVLTLGLAGAAIGVLATSIVSVLVAVYNAPHVAKAAVSLPWRWPERVTTTAIVKLGIASLLLGVASTTSDLLVRSRIVSRLGIAGVGVYQPVFSISNQYLVVFIGAIGIYLFPTLTRLINSGESAKAEAEMNSGFRMMLYVFTPLLIFIVLVSPAVIRALYSAEFMGAVPVLRIQLAGDIVKVCAYSLGAVLLPLGLTRSWAAIGLGTVAINLGLSWSLLPVLGLMGVGVGYSASWVFNLAATVLVLRRNDDQWVSRPVVGLIAASSLSVGLIVLTSAIVRPEISVSVGVLMLTTWSWLAFRRLRGWFAVEGVQ